MRSRVQPNILFSDPNALSEKSLSKQKGYFRY
jgi:hypothetical protein